MLPILSLLQKELQQDDKLDTLLQNILPANLRGKVKLCYVNYRNKDLFYLYSESGTVLEKCKVSLGKYGLYFGILNQLRGENEQICLYVDRRNILEQILIEATRDLVPEDAQISMNASVFH